MTVNRISVPLIFLSALFFLIHPGFIETSANAQSITQPPAQEKGKPESNQFNKIVVQGEKPESTRFNKTVLVDQLDEPMSFKILPDGRILFVERKGGIKIYNPASKTLKIVGNIPVSVGYYSTTGKVNSPNGEDGMLGVAVDPAFDKNHWIYLYYSPEGGTHRSILTRMEIKGDSLNKASEKILLEVPNQRESCCHLGGGMLFDHRGNLYLSTGDNTPNAFDAFSPLDEREGESRMDAQRSSGNPNDLRGKILRIHPEPTGTYTIPDGNLFPKDAEKTRPEVYTMGNRNPWRLSMDSKTGWLYWGEVGPGGTADSDLRGPRSYDEFNQAKGPGNFGWPYFIADNKSFQNYDYASKKTSGPFDPRSPVNDSPNNTGIAKLPPAIPALIWYPQSAAVDFPLMGSGSNSAVGGPVYHRSDFKNPKRPFPTYYEGKWLITDWTRGWIMAVSFDERGAFSAMEEVMPAGSFSGPIDMSFGPDGDLYLLEYGRGPYQRNYDARLVRIEYESGNRKPMVVISADKPAGSAPLRTQLSSEGTKDYDGDKLQYEWKITKGGKLIFTYKEASPSVTLNTPGLYTATLSVNDSHHNFSTASMQIAVGNEPPAVKLDLGNSNKSFFFPDEVLNYSVVVRDQEDEHLPDEKIDVSKIAVQIDYLQNDFRLEYLRSELKRSPAIEPLQSVLAKQVMQMSDCNACHLPDKKAVGPSLTDIASRYKNNATASAVLAEKVRSGGNGVWGHETMPAHPTLAEEDIRIVVTYILSLADSQKVVMPVRGNYKIMLPAGTEPRRAGQATGHNAFILRASYTDKGSEFSPSQFSTDLVVLRNPSIPAEYFDDYVNIEMNHAITRDATTMFPKSSGAYFVLNNINLDEIRQIDFRSTGEAVNQSDLSNWRIELRIDSKDGKVIGKTTGVSVREAQGGGRPTTWIKAPIESTDGFHDLYFVFVYSPPSKTIRIANVNFVQ